MINLEKLQKNEMRRAPQSPYNINRIKTVRV